MTFAIETVVSADTVPAAPEPAVPTMLTSRNRRYPGACESGWSTVAEYARPETAYPGRTDWRECRMNGPTVSGWPVVCGFGRPAWVPAWPCAAIAMCPLLLSDELQRRVRVSGLGVGAGPGSQQPVPEDDPG